MQSLYGAIANTNKKEIMAVSIDRVYQKVLALANKEQRGYITPQEFNLFADHAQMEIFEQYFYDINQLKRTPGNNSEYADIINNLEEKISIFEKTSAISYGIIDASDIYRLGTIIADGSLIVEEVQQDEVVRMNTTQLTKPTEKRPVYVRTGMNTATFYPSFSFTGTCTYTAKPTKPSWGYVVINDKPLYNSTSSIDFQLHPAEETELVYRILTLAGIAIEKPQLMQAAGGLGGVQIQQEKQ